MLMFYKPINNFLNLIGNDFFNIYVFFFKIDFFSSKNNLRNVKMLFFFKKRNKINTREITEYFFFLLSFHFFFFFLLSEISIQKIIVAICCL